MGDAANNLLTVTNCLLTPSSSSFVTMSDLIAVGQMSIHLEQIVETKASQIVETREPIN